jgi:hypothetical protein
MKDKKIILGICLLLLFTGCLDHLDQNHDDCSNICLSNNLTYMKYVSRGYAGTQPICYCQDSLGKISTYPM